ncbi:MAG: hypothetical protein JXQ71_04000 [Verrucomicrobia bacterium]|nr:hypothetical protein [Verrucomicrobiota bacterium]
MLAFVPDVAWCVIVGLLVGVGGLLLGRRHKVAGGFCLLLAALFVAGTVLPDVDWGGRHTAAGVCRANLAQIQGAKQAWAAALNKAPTDIPQDTDLFGPGKYIATKPVCPAGGVYRLGAVNENPTCSITNPPHALPPRRVNRL